MRLAIPFEFHGALYTSVDLKQPTPGVIAATQEAFQKGVFRAVHTWVAGSIAALESNEGDSITDQVTIKEAARAMPLRSAELVTIYALLEGDEDDGIEGRYICPSCGNVIVREFVSEEDDTRHHIRDLPVVNADLESWPAPRLIAHELTQPVEILERTKDHEGLVGSSFSITQPTVAHAISAELEVPDMGTMRGQIALLAQCLVELNGEAVRPAMAATYGSRLFGSMPRKDLSVISRETRRYGIQQEVTLACPRCRKAFQEVVNTTSFFVSALAS